MVPLEPTVQPRGYFLFRQIVELSRDRSLLAPTRRTWSHGFGQRKLRLAINRPVGMPEASIAIFPDCRKKSPLPRSGYPFP